MRQAKGIALPPPGSHIYAYCHVRTNQVLYSLSRYLQPEHLKQLPDAGANNTPPTIRRDQWRPLFTVSMPQNEAGVKHGLYIMHKLREYRKLHETMWKPSPLLSRPYTQKEIDEMQRDIDNRGGSKTETVYDIMKRKKRAMRAKSVMDQKANSIADLAAILEKTEERAKKAEEENQRDQQKHIDLSRREMLELEKKAKTGEVEKLESRRAQLQEEIVSISDKQKKRMQREIDGLTLKIDMMLFASKAVADAREKAQPELAAQEEKVTESDTSTPLRSEEQIVLESLPAWPREIDPYLIVANRKKNDKTPKGLHHRKILQFDRPIHSTEGIVVSWANPLDQEYAARWPENVNWRLMGLTVHTAQIPLDSPENPWQQRPDDEEKVSDGPLDVTTLNEWRRFRGSNPKNAAKKQREILFKQMKNDIVASILSGQSANDKVQNEASTPKLVKHAESENQNQSQPERTQ